MSNVSVEFKEPTAQKYVMWIAIGLFVIALLAYVAAHGKWQWPLNISKDTDVWGALGDYLGGVINPIVGLLTIWLLTVSLRQNQVILKHTQLELAATRDAIEQAGSIQAATEAALRKQIEIAEYARDMNNAVAISTAYRDRYRFAKSEEKKYQLQHPQRDGWLAKLSNLRAEVEQIEVVVKQEKERLEKLYLNKPAKS